MDNDYLLKHQNVDVAQFSINRSYNRINYLKILDERFSPVNMEEDNLSQAISFNDWLSERCVPNSREGVARLLSKYKVEQIKQLMLYMKGLSLSDHFWIDRTPFNQKWENINMFDNRYDELMGQLLFDQKLKLVQSAENYQGQSPELTTGGSLRKHWTYKEVEHKSYLLKAGSKKDYQEPFNEYFSHLLSEELGFTHTPYLLEKQGKEYVSVCPCIADNKTEMVSAADIIRKYGVEKSYNAFVQFGQQKGCINFKDEVNQMIILDYLIDNIDRHWYNFGMLRDAQDGSWKGLIPIFDNGYSLWNKDYVDSRIISESQSFADSNEDCMKLLDITKYVKHIPNMVQLFERAFDCYPLPERKKEIRQGLIERVRDIERYFDESLKRQIN